MKSKSNLLNYISVLLSDDEALNTFLVDPITESEGTYGITKAERAVLRRTVSHLSNKSKNGYTVKRHLGSYRRSLRLLQNVLHNTGSKMTVNEKPRRRKLTSNDDDDITVQMVVYFPPNIVGSTILTGYTNEQLQTQYGSPYSNHHIFKTEVPEGSTIKDVMDTLHEDYPDFFDYSDQDSNGEDGDYVSAIDIFAPLSVERPLTNISADLYSYNANDGDDYVFWFFSINGQAGKGKNGSASKPYGSYTVNDGDTIMWQMIAPDSTYGFQSCETTDGAEYNH
jgi:hypothetical protein